MARGWATMPGLRPRPDLDANATMPSEPPFDSVLLLAYGGPERMEDVRPFLDNILRGLPVPKERYEAVVHHYELIGGKSPLNELTDRQASGLPRPPPSRGARPCPSTSGCGSRSPSSIRPSAT